MTFAGDVFDENNLTGLDLADFAVAGGYLGLPAWTHAPNFLEGWLAPVLDASKGHIQWKSELLLSGGDVAALVPFQALHSHTGELILMAVSVLIALSAIFLARKIYGKAYRSPEEEAALFGAGIHQLIHNKYYVDEIYNAWIVKPALALMERIALFDKAVIDGLVNLMGILMRIVAKIVAFFDFRGVDGLVHTLVDITAACAKRTRQIQTGRVQNYIFGAVAGATLLVFVTFLF